MTRKDFFKGLGLGIIALPFVVNAKKKEPELSHDEYYKFMKGLIAGTDLPPEFLGFHQGGIIKPVSNNELNKVVTALKGEHFEGIVKFY